MQLRQAWRRHAQAINACPEYYRDMANWPDFDDSTIRDKGSRARFEGLSKAIALLLANQSRETVMAVCPVSERQLFRIFHSAIQQKPDVGINGYSALSARQVQRPRRRTATFSPTAKSTGGYTGLFSALLVAYPSIEDGLCAFLNARERPNKTTPHVLHVEFMRLVVLAGVGPEQYPRNTESEARRPLERWRLTVYLVRHQRRYMQREHGAAAATALAHSTGDGQSMSRVDAWGHWVLDEIVVDVNARFEVPSGLGDWDEYDLRRFSVIRMRTVALGVNLGWRLVLTPQVTGEDLAILLYEALSGPRKAQAVVAGLDYMAGADYPANRFAQLRFAAPLVIMLDNALSHLKDAFQNLVTARLGAEVKLGSPGDPKARAQIESTFSKMARQVSHQLPSTTGSGPKDPVRQSSAVELPSRIEVAALEHVYDVYIANENVLSASASNHLSPFERLERLLSRNLLRLAVLPEARRRPHYFSQRVRVRVRVDLVSGRKPHVNYLYARYSSESLRRKPGMKGQYIWVMADFRNLQMLLAFDEEGCEMAPLFAEGHRGRVPNDLRLRKIYAKLRRAGALGPRADDQPLQALYAYLRAGAPANRTLALQMAYVVRYLTGQLDVAQLQEMELSAEIGTTVPPAKAVELIQWEGGYTAPGLRDDLPAAVQPSPEQKGSAVVAAAPVATRLGLQRIGVPRSIRR